jgi:uncharacterized protein YkwD
MSKKILYISIVIFAFSCSKDETIVSKKEENIVSKTPENDIDKKIILTFVNSLRKTGCTCGTEIMPPVNEVVWEETLEKTAYLHSKDMSDNKYFSHNALSGTDPGQRIKTQGYTWKTYGENIFMATGFQPSETQVLMAWQESPGHCKNLMSPQFKEMGVGEFNSHWTQVFATK